MHLAFASCVAARRRSTIIVAAGLSALLLAGHGRAADPPAATAPTAADEALVIDAATQWRFFPMSDAWHVRQPDGTLLRTGLGNDGRQGKVPHWDETDSSPPPPAGWTAVEFADGDWARSRLPQPSLDGVGGWIGGGAHITGMTTTHAFLRGRFLVPDPKRVKALRLSLDYAGGVVVHVNGKEVVRGNVAAGQKSLAETVAEDYPEAAWTKPDGTPLGGWGPELEKIKDRTALRTRRLNEVEIPVGLLRQGTNVVSIEVHPAPIDHKGLPKGEHGGVFTPIGLTTVRLVAAPAGVATSSASHGFTVWNCAVHDTVSMADVGNPAEPLRPIVIHAARNSVFSGRLMVASDQPIKGLKVKVTDLAARGGGTIAAAAVRVRHAVPATEGKSWLARNRFDGLFEEIPAEIPLVEPPLSGPTPRAFAPLWFTVKVPRETAAGVYEGSVTITAEGQPATTTPLRVRVCDWVLTDPKDFQIQNAFTCAEEVHAKHYGVPNYSEQHMKLIGRSLALGAELNSRQVPANLAIDFCAQANQGGSNPESLVRWVKQPDGSFTHDFTVFDRYLDMVAASVGTPQTLALNCWGDKLKDDLFFGPHGATLPVSVLDKATGELSTMKQPVPGTEEAYQFWKPVFDGVLQRVKARGWEKETTIGYRSAYPPPPPDVVSMAHRLWPEGEWSWVSHSRAAGPFAGEQDVRMPVRHTDFVYGFPTHAGALLAGGDPTSTRRGRTVFCLRLGLPPNVPLWYQRRLVEIAALNMNIDGLGSQGLDLFPLKRPAGGFVQPAGGRGTPWFQGGTLAFLYPGPNGAVATERFEAVREGIELCEAVLFIRRAVASQPLDDELKARADRYVRMSPVLGLPGGDRQRAVGQRTKLGVLLMQSVEDENLLDLAGEVARAIERKK